MKAILHLILCAPLLGGIFLGSGCDKSCEQACQKTCQSRKNALYEEMKVEYGPKLERLSTEHCARACEGMVEKKGIETDTCKSYLAE